MGGELMKRVYYSVLCLAALAVAACNKEGVQTAGESLCANAYISSSATKTVYEIGNFGENARTKVSWSDAESFKAYYDGGASPVIFSKTAAGTSFTAESVPEGVTVSTPFTGLYGSAATLNSEGKIDIDFSKQNGEAGNLSAYDVMTATSELKDGALSFAFKHNCAILRLKCINHYEKEISKLKLDFECAKLSEAFASTCLSVMDYKQSASLSITLKKPVAAGSPVKDKGTVEYRYVIVPAMKFESSNYASIGFGGEWFDETISLSEKKSIEAGKVYDVVCHAGVEGDENGNIWID